MISESYITQDLSRPLPTQRRRSAAGSVPAHTMAALCAVEHPAAITRRPVACMVCLRPVYTTVHWPPAVTAADHDHRRDHRDCYITVTCSPSVTVSSCFESESDSVSDDDRRPSRGRSQARLASVVSESESGHSGPGSRWPGVSSVQVRIVVLP
jgi:hypothetical protein